jgi:hemerythrin-like metal-binding protein
MSLVAWQDRFALGIPVVDAQHQVMINIINEFHDGLVAGTAMESLAATLDRLVEHTVLHFGTEESFMILHGFQGLERHQLEHRLLLEEVAAFQARWTRDPGAVRPLDIPRFLADWLSHHILEQDSEFARYLTRAGS